MAENKHIDKNAYIWSHVGVIIFHILYGGIIAYIAWKYIVSQDLKTIRLILLIMGGFLVLLSGLSLIPILKDYDTITIN